MAEPFAVESLQTIPPPTPTPKRIGGWLVLLAIAQVFGVIGQINSLLLFSKNKEIFVAYPIGAYGELLINLAYLGLICVVSYNLFMRKRGFKFWLIAAVALADVVLGTMYLWWSAILGVSLTHVADAHEIRLTIGQNIVGIIWVAYLWRSKRAANTFVN
jgi:hypothetical protein